MGWNDSEGDRRYRNCTGKRHQNKVVLWGRQRAQAEWVWGIGYNRHVYWYLFELLERFHGRWQLCLTTGWCAWTMWFEGLSNSKSRWLEAIQRELVRQNVLPDVLDVRESSFVIGEQWWLRWLGRSVTAVDPNNGKSDFYLKWNELMKSSMTKSLQIACMSSTLNILFIAVVILKLWAQETNRYLAICWKCGKYAYLVVLSDMLMFMPFAYN